MEMAMYLVTAVLTEGRSPREVAAAHGVSKTWVYELLSRYRVDGEAGLVARSRRPGRSPTKVSHRFEDDIVRIRKTLAEEGFDAGAETIRVHLARGRRGTVPSVSTIWRVLKSRGFVTPQPHKRPKSSYVRFAAELDRFVDYYNTVRPHRALARRTPTIAFNARTKATPANAPLAAVPHCRIRQDKVNAGNVTLRYRTRLYHLAVGRRHEATRVLILAANRDIRILTTDGELLRHLILDPSRPYQPLGQPGSP
jgi:transposase